MMLKMRTKKGISPIIATVLLIMLAITAVGLVYYFVKPIINDMLIKAECHKAIGQIYTDTGSQYTCYNVWTNVTDGKKYSILTMSVKRGAEPLDIKEFVVIVNGAGTSESFNIKEGLVSSADPVRMFQNWDQNIVIPKRREMETYRINTTLPEITSVEIAPILKGNNVCDQVDRKDIDLC